MCFCFKNNNKGKKKDLEGKRRQARTPGWGRGKLLGTGMQETPRGRRGLQLLPRHDSLPFYYCVPQHHGYCTPKSTVLRIKHLQGEYGLGVPA